MNPLPACVVLGLVVWAPGAVASESSDRVHLMRAGSLDHLLLGVRVGLAAPVAKADIYGIVGTPTVTRFDQRIDAGTRAGLHAGLTCDWQRTWWELDDDAKVGWTLGTELAYDDHRGSIDGVTNSVGGQVAPSGSLSLQALSGAAVGGLLARWYVGSTPSDTLRAIQVHLTPLVGAGAARARASSDRSDAGLYIRYGVRLAALAEIGEGTLLGVDAGWEGAWARVHWRNADDAVIRAGGLAAALVAAQRW